MTPNAADFLRSLYETRAGLATLHTGLASLDPSDAADVARLRASLGVCVDAAKSSVDAMDALIGLVLLARQSSPAPSSKPGSGPFSPFRKQRQ